MRSTPLDAATLEACVAAAVAAPSIHNTQPWRFRLDPEIPAFEVRAAAERGLRHTDPVGRALHLSVGASVFNLRVAAAHFGWSPFVRLLPRPEDPGLLATVRMDGCRSGHATGHRDDLYPAIWRRHSSRFPFSARPLPRHAPAELAEAAQMEGASLGFPAAGEIARLLRVAGQAELRNRADGARGAESRRWVHQDPDSPAETGLPWSALGPQDARERLPMRDFTAQRHSERLPAQDFETEPVVGLLTTVHDRRADWLRAGQALEHALLVATVHGLRASLLHQPMEWPDLRRALSPDPEHSGHAQMLIRFGYGPAGPLTPRNDPHVALGTQAPLI
ncbi:Acg family FMN-binding oxidoreductase [Streptomyces justiciae]|uniref:Acg family FMN-binding oxidoreductase n=1 Tax=Streptomyces justiciae TaxID=2780140 RepID=UPI00188252B1|nr:nitroreductase family protein [Streptomyces justiciae]MBE8471896.1 nitroreductase family protein [Streptomyces justiciae]MCW8376227.1 nitroreductase family protein [Streptomyces justiciae]